MVMRNATTGRFKTDLPALYDELEAKIRALESLGWTQDKYGEFLSPLVESCLAEDILLAFERSKNFKEDSPGPNLIEQIPDIFDRFRRYPVGLSADIEKAFLQL
ncbi:uncharacterized protein TNCV_4185581 [Trichonephila clavipes]|nr:uncharacterized protein TNCV_4185581 [Trichonephila clavipes]